MPNTEDIEAKLCAYVDGELDEAGRGEIERHLTTNPQHRKLIDELTQQRDFLRALPRARAPVDVAETLHAQLERSALLSEDDWRDQPIRLSRWPQIRAAAALLLLVFGLAAVVYYVVPSPNQPGPIAVLDGAAEVDVRVTEAAVPTTRPTIPAGGMVLTGRGEPDLEFARVTPPALRNPVVSNAIAPQFEILRDAFAASAPSSRGQVQVVVAAADVGEAQRRVTEYFSERGVEVEPRHAGAPGPQALSIDVSQRAARALLRSDQGAREQKKEVGEIPDIPQSPGDEKQKDQAGADQPPDAQGFARAQDLSTDEPREQAYAARLPRRDVNEFCRAFSNPFAGCAAQVVEETAGEASIGGGAEASTFTAVTFGDWNGLFRWLAGSRTSPAAQETRLSFASAARDAGGDEEVDVLILVRPDAALQLQQQQQAISHEPAPEPEQPAPAQPVTSPATSPSSP